MARKTHGLHTCLDPPMSLEGNSTPSSSLQRWARRRMAPHKRGENAETADPRPNLVLVGNLALVERAADLTHVKVCRYFGRDRLCCRK